MKKLVLLKIAVLIEAEEKEIEKKFGYIDKITYDIEESINKTLGVDNENNQLGWLSTESMVLEKNISNYGKCQSCKAWTSDTEKEGFIKELGIGATVNGQLLCDECLPKKHPLAF